MHDCKGQTGNLDRHGEDMVVPPGGYFFLRPESLLLEDGIHLSEEGHLIYTNYLIPRY